MILDMRCRPPFGSFTELPLFNPWDGPFSTDRFCKAFGCQHAESVQKKSVDLLLKEMKEAGIDRAVVPVRKKTDKDNETLAELVKTYPDIFIGSAGVDPLGGESAITDIKKYVIDGPCTAIAMEPGMCKPPIFANDERIFPIYEYCEQNNVPLMLSYGGYVGHVDMEYYHPKYLEPVAKTFPNLKIALIHGAWPWVTQVVHLTYRFDNIYLLPDIYALKSAGAWDYITAANYMLRDKFIFGSAYPVVDLKCAVDQYLSRLNEDVKEKVMRLNACKFLGIEA